MILPRRNPIHLYRSLLREASYLFDPIAQSFHADYIRWSFRRQRSKHNFRRVKLVQDGWAVLLSQHDSKQLKRARQYLYTLERANQGYVTSVKNVLRMAYARKGKQKRVMVKDTMTPPSANDLTIPPTPTMYGRDWHPPPKFSALLKSQQKVQTWLDRGNKKIHPFPKIPVKNRWNKPFPPSRMKGIFSKWYARNADLLMPPLQETQWMDIYQAAMQGTTSKKTHFKIPQRRPIGAVHVFTKPEDDSAQWADKIDSLIQTSAQKPQRSQRVRANMGNPHHLTNRFLRRMTQQAVLGNTSTMVVDPSTGKSAFRWDSGVKPHATPSKCTESQQASFFD